MLGGRLLGVMLVGVTLVGVTLVGVTLVEGRLEGRREGFLIVSLDDQGRYGIPLLEYFTLCTDISCLFDLSFLDAVCGQILQSVS